MMGGAVVIHATDDDIVPYDEGVTLSRGLDVPLVTLESGKHLGGSQGNFELPSVLEGLKTLGLYSERKT
jgi:predicted alpha/beta hydrolase family esterase